MQLPRYLYIIAGFVGLVLVVNLLLLDYFLVSQRNDLLDFQTRLTQLSESFKLLGGRLLTGAGQTSQTSQTSQTVGPAEACPSSCVAMITVATISARQSAAPVTVQPTTTTTPSSKGEYFVPLGSGSVAQTSNWTDVTTAQATFNAGNYGNISAAYFEVFLRTSGSGEVHARLFDVTTPAIFWTSDVKTTNSSSTFLSAPITLSSGSKVYRVQIYSTISTGVLDQARIRIVTQ